MVKQPPYDVGDEIILFVEYVDETNAPADPDSVTLQIGRRDGTILETLQTGDLLNPSTGRWEHAYTIAEADLRFSWDAVGTVTIAVEGLIPTRRRTLPRP